MDIDEGVDSFWLCILCFRIWLYWTLSKRASDLEVEGGDSGVGFRDVGGEVFLSDVVGVDITFLCRDGSGEHCDHEVSSHSVDRSTHHVLRESLLVPAEPRRMS